MLWGGAVRGSAQPGTPIPRLPDGHPDLGNGKGAWTPRIVDDISGNGRGEKDEKTLGKVELLARGALTTVTKGQNPALEIRSRTLSNDINEGCRYARNPRGSS